MWSRQFILICLVCAFLGFTAGLFASVYVQEQLDQFLVPWTEHEQPDAVRQELRRPSVEEHNQHWKGDPYSGYYWYATARRLFIP